MNKKIKIGMVCYPTFGGSGVVATELGKALAEQGHEVHFISYSQPIRLDFIADNLFYHEVVVGEYPLFEFVPYESALTSKMVSVVKNKGLDLLHVHYAIPHASSAFMAKQILLQQNIFIPVVTTLHGTDITLVGKEAAYKPIVSFSIDQSDGVTAVSQSLKNETLTSIKVTKEIEVIPNFIDIEKFKKEKRHDKKTICSTQEALLVHISNFRAVKRVQDVIKIFYEIRKKIVAKLVMIGDGPDRLDAEMLSRQLNLTKDISFIGKMQNVIEVLSIADLFLMPSEKESFGLAALEAMACETPVVSSNTGGIPELNLHGTTGFLSAIGDIEEMAKNSLFVLDKNNLSTFKKNALEQARTFDVNTIRPLYENYYMAVVAHHKKAH